jgi:uncharacterized protein (DUF58 family)
MRRESLLGKVQARLAVRARKPSADVIEGEHGSIHRGRSMDFDDLREYTLGDDVKDIDWKATARAGRPLVKRYIATRRHAVLLVADTGRSMAALAAPGSAKRDVAVLAAGVIAQIAMTHGDSIGLVAGPMPTHIELGGRSRDRSRRIAYLPPLRGDLHLERVLRTIHDGIDADGAPSDVAALLDHVATHVQRRAILVVVADDVELDPRAEQLLRGLATKHEILHCAIGDVAVTDPVLAGTVMRTVESRVTVPAYLRAHPQVHNDVLELAKSRDAARRSSLARSGIPSARISDEASVISSVVTLLERQRLFGTGGR